MEKSPIEENASIKKKKIRISKIAVLKYIFWLDILILFIKKLKILINLIINKDVQ